MNSFGRLWVEIQKRTQQRKHEIKHREHLKTRIFKEVQMLSEPIVYVMQMRLLAPRRAKCRNRCYKHIQNSEYFKQLLQIRYIDKLLYV